MTFFKGAEYLALLTILTIIYVVSSKQIINSHLFRWLSNIQIILSPIIFLMFAVAFLSVSLFLCLITIALMVLVVYLMLYVRNLRLHPVNDASKAPER
jgi:Ca2+/Na+ antiporter